MWFKVVKDFGHRKAGEVIELKEDAQHQHLVDKGLLEETDEPKSEVKPVDPNASYSTANIVEQSPKKPGRKPKEENQ